MNVRCRVKSIDVSKAKRSVEADRKRAVVSVTEAARMDTLPYVPWVTGALARTADTESKPERGLLIYGNSAVPYARAQYYGMENKTTEWHPLACMQWFERSKAVNSLKWRRIAAAEFKKG